MARKIKSTLKRWKLKTPKKASKFTLAQVVTISVSIAVISLLMGIGVTYAVLSKSNNPAITKFLSEYSKLKDNYYKDIKDEDAMKTALEAIINSLDNYTTVVDDNLSNSLSTSLQGEYEGFGIQVANDDAKNIVVVGVIKDSPAEKAGFEPLDMIVSMDGEKISGLTTSQFATKVKNSKKSEFSIVVKRDNKEITLKLKREKVTLTSVVSDVIERDNKKIGYIYVNLFAYNTDIQFRKELLSLEQKGIDSLIVDLRYNTGGHLSSVENMMSEFLDKSHVIYQIESKDGTTKHYSNTSNKRSYKMVVLVNEHSASAAEMFTATMKEEYGATVVGVTTYGKGTVQEVQDAESIGEQYKITTKKWLTPKGNWINEKGIKPDVEVKLTDYEKDNQLEAAIKVLTK